VYALTVVPGLICGGPISDRFGRRPTAIAAASIALIGNLMLAGAPASYVALLVGRALVGLGSGATFSAGSAWLVDLDHAESAKRATASMAAGFGSGPLVAGVLAATLPAPLLIPYLVQASLLLVALAFAATVHSERLDLSAPLPGPAQAPLTARSFICNIVPVAPWVFTFPSLGFIVIPSQFAQTLGPAPLFVGLMAAATLFTGAAVARLAARRTTGGAALGLVAGAIGIGFGQLALYAQLRGLAVASGCLLGVGYGWTMTRTFQHVVTHSTPRWRATLVGITYALSYVGFGAPLLFARIAREITSAETMGVFVAAALFTARINRKRA
jgi:MFS family permease